MRKSILIIFFTLAVITAWATSVEVSGNVVGTWDADTVWVMSDLLVPDGQALVIAPGTRVICWGHFKIEVQGNINAIGLPGDSIVFTIRDTANFLNQASDRGGWFGIRFNQTPAWNDTSRFSYCRFEYGKALGDSTDQYGGAIYANSFSKLRISNCLFWYNYSFFSGGAVFLWQSNALITDNAFIGNYAGNTGTIYGYGGGICALHASPVIIRNRLLANSSTGVGGGISFDDADPVFYDNIFVNNYSALGGALGVLRSAPSSTFSNLLVINNSSLFFGGGICCIRSFPKFSNITVTGNSSIYGGGIYCNDSAAPAFYNSVIHGNDGFGISAYIWDIRSAPNFYYSDIQGDTAGFEGSGGHEGYHGEYLNNIDEMPQFYGQGNYPFSLNGNSPCIDNGTPDVTGLNLPGHDLAGGPRIWNNRIDMGAYEYNGTTSVAGGKSKAECDFTVIPNPFHDVFDIEFLKETSGAMKFRILNQMGKIVTRFGIPPGTSHFTVNTSKQVPGGLLPGTYIIEGIGNSYKSSRMIIKL